MGKSKHTMALEEMVAHPEKIGICEDVNWKYVEFPFYNRKGRMLGAVDVIIRTVDGGLFYVEYKCHDAVKPRLHAAEQLMIAKKGMHDEYKWDANRLLYVHDDLQPELFIPSDKFLKIDPNSAEDVEKLRFKGHNDKLATLAEHYIQLRKNVR